MVLSLWSVATGLLILIGSLTFLLISPLPRVIIFPLAKLIKKIQTLFFGTLLVFGLAIYRSYIGFTVHFPFVTVNDVKTVEQMSLILSRHYKHQRNFYIATFALTMNLILLRVAQIYVQNEEIQNELEKNKLKQE
eukprot:gene1604-12729_t